MFFFFFFFLGLVLQAVKDDIGSIRIQRPQKGPFYVSDKTIDQLIANLGKWSRFINLLLCSLYIWSGLQTPYIYWSRIWCTSVKVTSSAYLICFCPSDCTSMPRWVLRLLAFICLLSMLSNISWIEDVSGKCGKGKIFIRPSFLNSFYSCSYVAKTMVYVGFLMLQLKKLGKRKEVAYWILTLIPFSLWLHALNQVLPDLSLMMCSFKWQSRDWIR